MLAIIQNLEKELSLAEKMHSEYQSKIVNRTTNHLETDMAMCDFYLGEMRAFKKVLDIIKNKEYKFKDEIDLINDQTKEIKKIREDINNIFDNLEV